MFRRVWFNICGGCNAQCAWCQTGHRNRQRRPAHEGFVAPGDFARAVEYMMEQGMIGPDSPIELYNFSEPFLHPQFNEIIAWLHRAGLKFGLSTNASHVKTFREPILQNLQYLSFSMPGFSQASYDRIHRLDFDAVKANIVTIAKNFRDHGLCGPCFINYHVYQFNQDEIDPACKFAMDHELGLQAFYAIIDDLNMYLDYLESKMPYEQLKRASQELFLYHVESLRSRQPAGFECRNREELVLNERCQVLLCCSGGMNDNSGVLGDLFQMSYDAIREAKSRQEICQRCVSAGCAYLMCNSPVLENMPEASVPGVCSPGDFADVVYVEQPPSFTGAFEKVSPSVLDSMLVEGWARDPAKDCAAGEILLLDEKRKVVACAPVNQRREDVVRAGKFDPARMQNCGFRIRFRQDRLMPGRQDLSGYTFNRAANVAYRLQNIVRLPCRLR